MPDYKFKLVSETRAIARAKARDTALREANQAKEATKAEEEETRTEILEAEALAILKARRESKAEEDARIDAAGTDEWFYIQEEEQIGPVGYTRLMEILWDPLTDPPLKLVWTEGMSEWRPFYDVQRLSDSKPVGSEETALSHGSSQQLEATVAELRAEAKAAEERAKALEEKANAENEARLREAAEEMLALAERSAREATAKAKEEAKLRTAAEARASKDAREAAEARAALNKEITLRQAAEATAAEERKLRTTAEAKAQEQTRKRKAAETEAREVLERKARSEETARAETAEANRLKAAADAKAAKEEQLRIAAEASAAKEAKLRAEAIRLKAAAEEQQIRIAAQAEATRQSELRALALAKAAETKARQKAKTKAAEAQKATDAEIHAAQAEEKRRSTEQLKAQAAETARNEKEARDAAAERSRTKAANKARIKAEKRAKHEAATKAKAAARAEKSRAAESKEKNNPSPAEPAPSPAKVNSPLVEPAKTKKLRGLLSRKSWFYTCEGERVGPVTFDELRDLATRLQIDPRLDRVWKRGSDSWQPAGEIDGLFERKPAQANPRATSGPPKIIADSRSGKSRSLAFTDRVWPGARRRSFLMASLAFPLLWQYSLGVASPHLVKNFGEALMVSILPVATLLPLFVFIHFGMQRLTNLGMSRWWLPAFLIPGLNLWVGYRCFVCQGGYAYHQKLDRTGAAAVVLYGGALLAAAIYPAVTVVPLFNALGATDLFKSIL